MAIKISADSALKTIRNYAGSMVEFSTETLVLLLPAVTSEVVRYTWIGPTNKKYEERVMTRDLEYDTDDKYAYSATIYPAMTSGIISDSGISYFSFRVGSTFSSSIKISITASNFPDQTDIPETQADELSAKINQNIADINTNKTDINTLENTTVNGQALGDGGVVLGSKDILHRVPHEDDVTVWDQLEATKTVDEIQNGKITQAQNNITELEETRINGQALGDGDIFLQSNNIVHKVPYEDDTTVADQLNANKGVNEAQQIEIDANTAEIAQVEADAAQANAAFDGRITANTNALDTKADLVNGLVPAAQLPSYVDDVIEVETYADLPVTGEAGKIYVVKYDEKTGNDASTYRWADTVYILINDTLSAAEIKTMYESNANTNGYTDAEKAKLLSLLSGTEYYSASEIEGRITDLLALNNLQDTQILFSGVDYVEDNATFDNSLFTPYNWIYMRFELTDKNKETYGFLKPSQGTEGNSVKFLIENKKYVTVTLGANSVVTFAVVNDSGNLTNEKATMKAWGIKLDGIDAEEIGYDPSGTRLTATDVDAALNEIANSDYSKTEIDAILDKKLATFAYNNESGIAENDKAYVDTIDTTKEAKVFVEGKKVYKNAIVGGDFGDNYVLAEYGDVSIDKFHINGVNACLTDVSNNIATFKAQARFNGMSSYFQPQGAGAKLYASARGKLHNYLQRFYINDGRGQLYLNTATTTVVDEWKTYSRIMNIAENPIQLKLLFQDDNVSDWEEVQFSDFIIINLDELIANKKYSTLYDKTFDLLTDEEITEQMDIWVKQEQKYLSAGNSTSFRGIPRSMIPTANDSIISKFDDTRFYITFGTDGNLADFYSSQPITLKAGDKIGIMYKTTTANNDAMEALESPYTVLYNRDTDNYDTLSRNIFYNSDTNIRSILFSSATDFNNNHWNILEKVLTGTLDELTVNNFVMLNLTELGEPDTISVTEMYTKYGPMIEDINSQETETATNVDVIEKGLNLINKDDFSVTVTNGYYEGPYNNYATGIKLEKNTNYTISYDYVIDQTNYDVYGNGGIYGSIGYAATDRTMTYEPKSILYPNQTSGRVSKTFNFDSFIYVDAYLGIRFARAGSPSTYSVTISNITILKDSEIISYIPYLEEINLGTLNPTAGEIQTIQYTPRQYGVLEFRNHVDGETSQPQYAESIDILDGTKLQFNDTAITDNWSSIVSKTNSNAVTGKDHEERIDDIEDVILSDAYNTSVGVTSNEFIYSDLVSLSANSMLKLHGKGQNSRNRMSATVLTGTENGITVTYDESTGIVTLNGTSTGVSNYVLAQNIDLDLETGDNVSVLRYYDSGTVDLNGAYIGYLLQGSAVSNRINENSESLYDPYISQVGTISDSDDTYGQRILIQFWKAGMVFTDFKFKIGIFKGTALQGYSLPSATGTTSEVQVFNTTANKLYPSGMATETTNGLDISYDATTQVFTVNGTATADTHLLMLGGFSGLSGDRYSITRYYVGGEATISGTAGLRFEDSTLTILVENILNTSNQYDTLFTTGTLSADKTIKLVFYAETGQVFDNYQFKAMITNDSVVTSSYIDYYRKSVGYLSLTGEEDSLDDYIEFQAIANGIIEIVQVGSAMDLLYSYSLTDTSNTTLEYNSDVFSSSLVTSILNERLGTLDNTYRNKTIAIWGDSRESNNPTSDPTSAGDQLDTSWPSLLGQKLSTSILNYGLSGGAWAENTYQQDADAAIVNRVSTQDVNAAADIIIISSMNDFKLATPLGSSATTNKDKTTFYGAMRVTYETLATKYPGKKILLVLPQKRYDEDVDYGGGSYYHYLQAQVIVANEYGIPIVDLYHNMPGVAGTSFYTTYMLNATHWTAAGNDRVAELVAKELIGNGNKGNMNDLPAIPTVDGTYTLQVTIVNGIPTFSWEL